MKIDDKTDLHYWENNGYYLWQYKTTFKGNVKTRVSETNKSKEEILDKFRNGSIEWENWS